MKKLQSGFTLIELMIVVAIVAILAAIAIPTLRDYMIRAKVSECAAALGACKTSVTEFNDEKGYPPTTRQSAGCSNRASKYCTGLDVAAGGAMTVSVTGTSSDADGCTLTLTPVADGDNYITEWTGTNGGSGTDCFKFVPSKFR